MKCTHKGSCTTDACMAALIDQQKRTIDMQRRMIEMLLKRTAPDKKRKIHICLN